MDRVLPVVAELAGRYPERTVFTRFITPNRPDDMPGIWQHYYTRWKEATREHLDPALLELLPPLAKLCPPATVINKTHYSAFAEPELLSRGGPGCLNRFSASISGASARVRLPSGVAAG